jgi:hypothetical protein
VCSKSGGSGSHQEGIQKPTIGRLVAMERAGEVTLVPCPGLLPRYCKHMKDQYVVVTPGLHVGDNKYIQRHAARKKAICSVWVLLERKRHWLKTKHMASKTLLSYPPLFTSPEKIKKSRVNPRLSFHQTNRPDKIEINGKVNATHK